MWFVYAPGSGVWFNTGRTRVFETHAVAAEKLCGRQVGPNDATEMVRCAVEAGKLDSFQLQYDWDVPENIEIVAVNLQGVYPCGAATSGTSASFRSGWMAANPCDCDNDAPHGFLNCKPGETSVKGKDLTRPITLSALPSTAASLIATLVAAAVLGACILFWACRRRRQARPDGLTPAVARPMDPRQECLLKSVGL